MPKSVEEILQNLCEKSPQCYDRTEIACKKCQDANKDIAQAIKELRELLPKEKPVKIKKKIGNIQRLFVDIKAEGYNQYRAEISKLFGGEER